MIIGFDHAIFLVAEADGLDHAAQSFEALGFSVTERDDAGKETAATAQKLICFADGSYIELLAIRDAEARSRHRFAHLLARGDGWADTSLVCDDLAAVQAALRRAGLLLGGPHRHERRLRSGEPWGVQLILPGIGAGHPALPFVIEDIEGRALRIPSRGIGHANGVTGTAGTTVSVKALAIAEPQFRAMLGAGSLSPLHEGGRCLRFQVGRQWLDVVERPQAEEGMVSLTLRRPGTVGLIWMADGRQAIAVLGD